MALTRNDRLRSADLEECGRVGEAFGLGAVEAVARELDDRSGLRWADRSALVIGFVGLIAGWPIAAAAAMSPSVYVGVIFGVLFVAAFPLMIMGKRLADVTARVCLYSGGLARIDGSAAGPVVLRWADVASVAVETSDDEGTPRAGVIECVLYGRTGGVITAHPDIRDYVVIAAHRALAPSVVPAMIRAYDSGQPLVIGPKVQVDQSGILFPRSKNRLAWTDIGVVVKTNPYPFAASVTTLMDLRKSAKGRSHHWCDPSGVPNGIFVFDLIVHAARQRGVQVQDYTG